MAPKKHRKFGTPFAGKLPSQSIVTSDIVSIAYSVNFFGGPTADTISGMHCICVPERLAFNICSLRIKYGF